MQEYQAKMKPENEVDRAFSKFSKHMALSIYNTEKRISVAL